MNKLLSQKNLLKVFAALLLIRFAVVPMWAWQGNYLESLSAKRVQLEKAQYLVQSKRGHAARLEALNKSILQARSHNWVDNEVTKLDIQKAIEKNLDDHNVIMQGFSWVFDEQSSFRKLRANVRFEGQSVGVILAFWELSRNRRAIRHVAWNYRLKDYSENSLGRITGEITLEFYAIDV